MAPLLSILLPVYNGEAYLRAALDSITGQRGVDQLEVIALDDGSTDQSPAILRQYASRLPLSIPPIARTGNWVTNTNHGLRLARGRYACFLHQDDLWLDGRMAWLLDTVAREPETPVLFSSATFIAPDHRAVGRWTAPFAGHRERRLEAAEWFCPLVVQNYIAIPAPIFRRDVALALPPMDDRLPYTADWKWWLNLARQQPALYRPQPTVGFRVHAASQTVSLSGDPDAYRAQLQSVLDEFAPFLPDTAAGRTWLAAARLGVAANVMLAAAFHRQRLPWRLLFHALRRAGLRGSLLHLNASRMFERLGARIRILLRPR